MHTDFTKMYIDGQWVEGSSDKSIDNTNPFTDETLFSIRSADESDLDKAYAVAKEAQTEWATMLPQNRRALIEKFAEVTLKTHLLL